MTRVLWRTLGLAILMVIAMAMPAAADYSFAGAEVDCVEVNPGIATVGDDGTLTVTGIQVSSYFDTDEALISGITRRTSSLRIDAYGNGSLRGTAVTYPTAYPDGWWKIRYTGTISGSDAFVSANGVGRGSLSGYFYSANLYSGADGCEAGGSNEVRGVLTYVAR